MKTISYLNEWRFYYYLEERNDLELREKKHNYNKHLLKLIKFIIIFITINIIWLLIQTVCEHEIGLPFKHFLINR